MISEAIQESRPMLPSDRCNESHCDQRATHLVTNRNGISFDGFLSCEGHISHFQMKAQAAGWKSTVEPWPKPLPSLQEQIDAQRKLVYEGDLEVKRCTEAVNIAEAISTRRHDALGELLNLRDLQKARENAEAVGPQIPRWG